MLLKLIILSFLLILPNLSMAAWTHVQSVANGTDCGTVTSCTVTFGSNTTAGSMLVAYWRVGAIGRTITVTDLQGNSWGSSPDVSQVNTTDGHTAGFNTAWNTVGGTTNQVTVAISGAAAIMRISVSEFSGGPSTNSLDKTNSTQGNSTTAASGTITPSANGELLLAISGNGGGLTYTAGADFTLRTQVPAANATKLAAESYVQPTAASHNGDFSMNATDQWSAGVASYKLTNSHQNIIQGTSIIRGVSTIN